MRKHALQVGFLLALAVVLLLLGACSGRGPRFGSPGELLWHYRMGGAIHSSPTVVNSVIYFGSNDHNVYALDSDSGEILWRYLTGREVRGSPTVSDGTVFIGSEDGHLYALDAESGELRWRYRAGGLMWSRPAVADGVVFGSTQARGDHLFALDAEDGSLIWLFRTGFFEGSSPVVSKGVVYVGSYGSGGRQYALDAATGKVLWSFLAGYPYSCGSEPGSDHSAEVGGGVLFFGSHDGYIYAIDAETGKRHWRFNANGRICSSLTEENGIVYFSTLEELIALDSESGELNWRYPFGGAESHPVIADGIVYVGSFDGHTYALDAQSGELWWKSPLSTVQSTSPAVSDGVVYSATQAGDVAALSAREGELVWLFSTGIGVEHPPGEEDRVWFFSRSGFVYALNAVTGQPHWRFAVEDVTRYYGISNPVLRSGVIYFAAASFELNDRVYGLHADTGEVIWRKELDDDLTAPPVVADGRIHVGTSKSLNALDSLTGEILWLYRPVGDDPVYSTFAVDGSDIYMGTAQGHVYALDSVTGEPIWQSSVGEMPLVSFGEGVLYASTYPDLVSALDADSGEVLWQKRTKGLVPAQKTVNRPSRGLSSPLASYVSPTDRLTRPVVGNGIVYVGSDDEYVYALDAETGALRWFFETPGKVTLAPIFSGAILYVAAQDHYIYALDAATGEAMWHHDGRSPATAMTVLDSVVYVSNANGYAYAVTGPSN